MDRQEVARRKAAPEAAGQKPVDAKNKYAKFKRETKTAQGFLYLRSLDPVLLQDAIESVTEAGDMISFTRTSDGGALCICITTAGERLKQYASTDAELNDLIQSLI